MLEIKYTQSNNNVHKLLDMLSIAEIDKALIRPTQGAASYVQKYKLSKPEGQWWSQGGQHLGVVSGNLRQSILPSVKAKDGIASLGTDLQYGADWELGHVPGKAKRPWLSSGVGEFVDSGKFVELFKKELFKALGV